MPTMPTMPTMTTNIGYCGEKHGGQDIYDNLANLIDDFSVTTNYLGPCPSALDHITNNIDLITHYPKEDQQPYKQNLLNFLFPTTAKNPHLIMGNGASELIELIVRLTPITTSTYYVDDTQYMEYERACVLNNYEKTPDINTADIICLINPCNPTGTYLSLEELKRKIQLAKPNSTILIDESMQLWRGKHFRKDSMLSQCEFVRQLLEKHNIHLYIIHSWTKFFSCTGLRIGSVLCPDESTYDRIQKHINPWNCNILALEYLDKCIQDCEYMEKTWNTTAKMRTQQIQMIRAHFPEWICHGADFLSWIWIELPDADIAEKLYIDSKIYNMPIRWGKTGYGKPNFIRIAVRKMENFRKLLCVWKCPTNSMENSLEQIMINLETKIKRVLVTDLRTHENINTDSGDKFYHYLVSLGDLKTMPAIIVDDDTNVIIDGHHRLYVLKKLNILAIDVISIKYSDDNEYITANPNNARITKRNVIDSGLSGIEMLPKTTQHMVCINNRQYPIIIMSKIIFIE